MKKFAVVLGLFVLSCYGAFAACTCTSGDIMKSLDGAGTSDKKDFVSSFFSNDDVTDELVYRLEHNWDFEKVINGYISSNCKVVANKITCN